MTDHRHDETCTYFRDHRDPAVTFPPEWWARKAEQLHTYLIKRYRNSGLHYDGAALAGTDEAIRDGQDRVEHGTWNCGPRTEKFDPDQCDDRARAAMYGYLKMVGREAATKHARTQHGARASERDALLLDAGHAPRLPGQGSVRLGPDSDNAAPDRAGDYRVRSGASAERLAHTKYDDKQYAQAAIELDEAGKKATVAQADDAPAGTDDAAWATSENLAVNFDAVALDPKGEHLEAERDPLSGKWETVGHRDGRLLTEDFGGVEGLGGDASASESRSADPMPREYVETSPLHGRVEPQDGKHKDPVPELGVAYGSSAESAALATMGEYERPHNVGGGRRTGALSNRQEKRRKKALMQVLTDYEVGNRVKCNAAAVYACMVDDLSDVKAGKTLGVSDKTYRDMRHQVQDLLGALVNDAGMFNTWGDMSRRKWRERLRWGKPYRKVPTKFVFSFVSLTTGEVVTITGKVARKYDDVYRALRDNGYTDPTTESVCLYWADMVSDTMRSLDAWVEEERELWPEGSEARAIPVLSENAEDYALLFKSPLPVSVDRLAAYRQWLWRVQAGGPVEPAEWQRVA